MDNLFFPLSKIFWSLVRPEAWMIVLMLVALGALVMQWRRLALISLTLAVSMYLTIAFFPVGDFLLRPLEAYAPAKPDLSAPVAIVVLGGGEETERSVASGLPSINDAGERFLAATDLARRFPEAHVVFTGGTGWFRQNTPPGSRVARQIFRQAGIADNRMILEGQSRNTWQNAVNTLPMMSDLVGKGPVVLVTSAFHMRRSLAAFCAAGWRDLAPYPVDFRAVRLSGRFGWHFAVNLRELDIALKEWVGLFAYQRAGRAQDPVATQGCLAPGMRVADARAT